MIVKVSELQKIGSFRAKDVDRAVKNGSLVDETGTPTDTDELSVLIRRDE